MAEIHGTYVYDDSLRPGKSQDGGLSQLLFDGHGNLTDHAVFFPDADNDDAIEPSDGLTPEEYGQAAAIAIGAGVVVVAGVVKAAPHVKAWWLDTVMPRFRKLSRTKPTREIEEPLGPVDDSRSVDAASDQIEERVSSDQTE